MALMHHLPAPCQVFFAKSSCWVQSASGSSTVSFRMAAFDLSLPSLLVLITLMRYFAPSSAEDGTRSISACPSTKAIFCWRFGPARLFPGVPVS